MAEFEYRVMYRHYDGRTVVYASGLRLNAARRDVLQNSANDDREWWMEERPLGEWERKGEVHIGGKPTGAEVSQ